jgi:hypothetical protein
MTLERLIACKGFENRQEAALFVLKKILEAPFGNRTETGRIKHGSIVANVATGPLSDSHVMHSLHVAGRSCMSHTCAIVTRKLDKVWVWFNGSLVDTIECPLWVKAMVERVAEIEAQDQ